MSEVSETFEEPVEPLFDVVIKVPPSARMEDIERNALAAGMAPERVERLMKVLQSAPHAKVGSEVNRERADLAREQFTKAGLYVEVTPVLAIQAGMAGAYDGTTVCPACDKRVVLPENRQCPACNIFVDKVTPEFLLRRKMMEQERSKIEFDRQKSAKENEKRTREALEAAMRDQIRAELEKEYGIGKPKGLFQGKSGLIRVVCLAGLMAGAFVGGRGLSPGGFPWSKSAATGADSGKTMTASSLEQSSQGGAGAAAAAKAAAGGTGADAGVPTGDADVDDPLIQNAGGKRVGAKGLTIEQAVAAAQVLGKSVGNTTAERAMGGGSGGPAGANAAAASGTGPTAGPAASSPAGGAPEAAAVPKQAKLVLTAEFASLLAELGQSVRAREVLKAANASLDAASNPEAATALRAAEIKSQAWALQNLDGSRAGQGAEAIKARLLDIASPLERTQLLGNVAVILSRNPQLSSDVPRAFLSLAADSLKSVSGSGQPNAALGDLAVSMAEVFSNETTARAKGGQWSKAQASAAQVEGLVKQAPDPWAQVRLQAVEAMVHQQLGHSDKATQSLDAALAQAGKNSNPAERAVWLRNIAQLADASSQESMQAMTTALQTQLEPKAGLEKAQALTQLTLLYANGGLPARAEHFRKLTQSTAGLTPADSTAITTDLIIRSDLAMARVLQGLGRYAEAEALLQRVSGYLF